MRNAYAVSDAQGGQSAGAMARVPDGALMQRAAAGLASRSCARPPAGRRRVVVLNRTTAAATRGRRTAGQTRRHPPCLP